MFCLTMVICFLQSRSESFYKKAKAALQHMQRIVCKLPMIASYNAAEKLAAIVGCSEVRTAMSNIVVKIIQLN